MGRLVVVTGVGTGIGKTHLAVALVMAARARGGSVAGYKPVESGLDGTAPGDAVALKEASSHAIEPAPLYAFVPPVSPHLAAEWAAQPIELERIVSAVDEARSQVDLLIVELAGGLFTPLGPSVDNATLSGLLRPDSLVLVAEDSLGVLHHVRSVVFASATRGLTPGHLALVTPTIHDASTGKNGAALATFFASHVSIPRAPRAELAQSQPIQALLDAITA